MNQKPLILITNDDSISAPGIRFLIDVMKELGDVVVVAPDSPQSAMGHAITINSTLSIEKIKKASVEELKVVESMDIRAAENLYNHFRKEG